MRWGRCSRGIVLRRWNSHLPDAAIAMSARYGNGALTKRPSTSQLEPAQPPEP